MTSKSQQNVTPRPPAVYSPILSYLVNHPSKRMSQMAATQSSIHLLATTTEYQLPVTAKLPTICLDGNTDVGTEAVLTQSDANTDSVDL